MIQTIENLGNDIPAQDAKAFMAQLTNLFSTVLQVMEDNERLTQRVAALESENAALTETVEQWKNNDEWSNRVTYDNVVDQIASLEDASKRDDARRMFEALLKKGQVTQFRRDIKKRVKELNEEGDAYSDNQEVVCGQGAGHRRQVEMGWCVLVFALVMQLSGGCQGFLCENKES